MSWRTNSIIIARNTFREAVRAKLLMVVVLLSVALISTVTLFGMVTIGDQLQVIRDFGLTTISLAAVGYTAIAGASLLEKELQKRRYNILSKSVSRWHFLLGKFFGLWVTVLLVGLIISVIIIFTAALFGDSSILPIFQGWFFISLEALILSASVILFSTILVTPSLAGLLTGAVFVVGRSSHFLLSFIEKNEISGVAKMLFEVLYWTLPNFALLNISDQVTFGDTISLSYTLECVVYALTYSAVLLLLATVFFERRDFN